MTEVGERRRIANANTEIGKKYGVLTIIAYAGSGSRGHTRVMCRCECGNEKDFGLSSLKRGEVGKECSCSRKRSCNYVMNQPDVQRPEPIRRDLKLTDYSDIGITSLIPSNELSRSLSKITITRAFTDKTSG